MDEQNQTTPEVITETDQQQNQTQNKLDEKAPTGLKVLSFFIPLAGLILFCVNYTDKPRYAKGCGIPALVGFFTIPLIIIVIVFSIIFITGLAIFSTASSTVMDTSSSLEAQAVETFNSTFEIYEGTQSYVSVRSLLSTVTNHNLTAEENDEIEVKLDGKTKTSTVARTEVETGKQYKVSFGYDLSGYIDEINIRTVK